MSNKTSSNIEMRFVDDLATKEVIQSKIEKIIGMTREEVTTVMGSFGEGLKVAGDVAADGSRIEIYKYPFLDDKYYLVFKNGILVKWIPASAYPKSDLRINIE